MSIIHTIFILFVIFIIIGMLYIRIIFKEQGKIELQDSIHPQSDLCTTCHHINCTCFLDEELYKHQNQ